MKALFLILFFSKVLLLTPEPVTISSEWFEINPQKTFSAITGGANIRIRIPVNDYRIKKIIKEKETFEQLENIFPKESIEAYLYGENNYIAHLSIVGFAVSDFNFKDEGSLHILLRPAFPIPTNVKFNRLKIKSNPEIENVKIYWENCSL
ncbi:MAG: hypothetical protein HGB12_12970 [Bacteroidetes bacterium]|nr:hypothetical protein [Bacteroidota bacterium]